MLWLVLAKIMNVSRRLGNQLENTTCEPFSSDLKVKVGSEYFYPDVMVVCNDDEENEYFTQSPAIIVEVLFRSTRRLDQIIKKIAYQNIASLQEYVLIEQDVVDIEGCRSLDGWVSQHLGAIGLMMCFKVNISLCRRLSALFRKAL